MTNSFVRSFCSLWNERALHVRVYATEFRLENRKLLYKPGKRNKKTKILFAITKNYLT